MPLSPTISACFGNCCKTLRVQDTTDVYNLTSNTGGWNSPNTAYDEVASATLTLTTPSGVEKTKTVTSQITDAAITGTFWFNDISSSEFGLSASGFADGSYTLLYTIVDTSGNTYTKTISIFNYCSVKCCVDQLIADIPEKMCANCDYEDYVHNALMAKALLEALKAAASCCNTTAMNNILEKIQKYCNLNGCTNC